MSPAVWDFTVTHVTGTEQMSVAGYSGRFPQLADQQMLTNHPRSCATAILPSIWMSMEMKHREYGNDVISGSEEHPVRKAP